MRLLGAALAACLLAACSSSGGHAESAAVAEVRAHAATAGAVMTGGHGPVPAREAAAAVVGVKNDTTIDALQADGTTYDGSVTLKITVTRSPGLVSETRSTQCFSYTFRHRLGDDEPHRLAKCPPGPALSLTAPAAAPGVSDKSAKAVRRALSALTTAQRRDAGRIREAVTHALGPGYQVETTSAVGGVDVRVGSGDQCLSAHVDAGGGIHVGRPAHGTSCRGG